MDPVICHVDASANQEKGAKGMYMRHHLSYGTGDRALEECRSYSYQHQNHAHSKRVAHEPTEGVAKSFGRESASYDDQKNWQSAAQGTHGVPDSEQENISEVFSWGDACSVSEADSERSMCY